MSDIPNFNNAIDEDAYQTIFNNKLNDYYIFMNAVRGKFFPNYNWDQITGETLSVLRDMTTMLIYNTTEEFRKEVPGYENKESIFVPRKDLLEVMKEAFEEFRNDK
jgi:hypothetical protein